MPSSILPVASSSRPGLSMGGGYDGSRGGYDGVGVMGGGMPRVDRIPLVLRRLGKFRSMVSPAKIQGYSGIPLD